MSRHHTVPPLAALLFTLLAGCRGTDQIDRPIPSSTTPPAAVTDLAVIASSGTGVSLAWTAPADPDGGGAAFYDLRYTALAKSDWGGWTPVAELPAPAAPGRRDTVTVSGLAPAGDLVFRLRTADADSNWSPLSNTAAGSPRTAPVRVWQVNASGTGDAPTIVAAIDSARPGDCILVAPGHYSWSNQGADNDYGMLFFPRDYQGVELRSEQGPAVTVLDAEGQGRVIFVQGYNDGLVIDGFTITGGVANAMGNYCGGGICAHLTTPTVRNCVITGNAAHRPGNFSGGQGGGVWCGGVSTLRLEACLITGNQADWGGGIFLVNSSDASIVTHCVIAGNTAVEYGGGAGGGNVTFRIEDCLIAHNTAGIAGGGVWGDLLAPSLLARSTISDNGAGTGGNIALQRGSSLRITQCILAYTTRGGDLAIGSQDTLRAACCDLFGNTGGNDLEIISDNLGSVFSTAPRFRDRAAGDYGLQEGSPCGPGNGTGCGVIGAYTTVSVPAPAGWDPQAPLPTGECPVR